MTARIQRTSASYPEWLYIFGSDTVSVLEPAKRNADGALRILVNVRELGDGAKQRLAVKLARAWRLSSDRVMEEMLKSGSIAISGEGVEMVEEAGRLEF